MAATTKPLTKAQIITALSEELGLAKKDVSGFFDALSDLAYKETKKKGAFVLPGFGNFSPCRDPDRMKFHQLSGIAYCRCVELESLVFFQLYLFRLDHNLCDCSIVLI